MSPVVIAALVGTAVGLALSVPTCWLVTRYLWRRWPIEAKPKWIEKLDG